VKGLAHITGGGLLENIPRILPGGCSVEIDTGSWRVPALFDLLQERGGVERAEMFRVFNMGVGMIFIIPEGEAPRLEACDLRWKPFRIGAVVEGGKEVVLK
ncbi:MAG TPA: phosphoribosylformylglycinamidine cyclo-ligase, partial [Candidatus Eisenbacteria bacterium]|nr:phosphoribosylformylglycinamidine cyclo-ligase [Candidatus Eisenbacteria bacterium]